MLKKNAAIKNPITSPKGKIEIHSKALIPPFWLLDPNFSTVRVQLPSLMGTG